MNLNFFRVIFSRSLVGLSLFVFLSSDIFAENYKHAKPVSIQSEVSGSGTFTLKYQGPWVHTWSESVSGTTVTELQIAPMWRERVYDLELISPSSITSAKVRLTAPEGWTVFMAESGSTDLKEREVLTVNLSGTATRTIKIAIKPIGGARKSLPTGESTSISDSEVNWWVGLGNLKNGKSAGAINMSREFDDEGCNVGDLSYSAPSPEVDVVKSFGTLRQVYAPQAIADIVPINWNYYEIRFYNWTQVGSKDPITGLYSVPSASSAFAVYGITAVDNVSGGPTGAGLYGTKITKTAGGATWSTRLVPDSYATKATLYDWTRGGNEKTQCLRKVVTVFGGSFVGVDWHASEEVTEYGRNSSGSYIESSKTRYVKKGISEYIQQAYEEKIKVLVSVEKGYGSAQSRKTSYEYFVAKSDGAGHYTKRKKEIRPDGGETRYQYYDDIDRLGMVEYKWEPYLETNEKRWTQYYYEANPITGEFVMDHIDEYTNTGGWVLSGWTTYDYLSHVRNGHSVLEVIQRDYPLGSSHLETRTMAYADTISDSFLRGMPYAEKRPDGTQTSYAYKLIGSVYVMESMQGTTSLPSGEGYNYLTTYFDGSHDIENIYIVNNKSIKRQTNVGAGGLPYASYESVGHASLIWDMMHETSFTYEGRTIDGTYFSNPANRLSLTMRRAWLNGVPSGSWNTESEFGYSGLELVAGRNAVGVETFTAFDKQGRIDVVEEIGSGGIGDVFTSYVYDGSNRVLSTERSGVGSSEMIVASSTYDLAGRVVSKTEDWSGTTTYEYLSATQKKTINADAGYVVETYRKDGSMVSITGNTASPVYLQTRVLSDGVETWTASQDFVIGQYMDNWKMEKVDSLGRKMVERSPTFDGGSRYIVYEYNAKGQLSAKRTRTSLSSGDLVAPYKYTYYPLGDIKFEGLDVGNNGLEENSSDRLTKSLNDYYKDGSGYWWARARTYAYPVSSAVEVSSVEAQLAPPLNTLQRTINRDAFGSYNDTVQVVSRSTHQVTETTNFYPSPTGDQVNVYLNGVLTSTNDPAGVSKTYEYDHLRRLKLVNGRDSVKEGKRYVYGSSRVSELYQVIPVTGSPEHTVTDFQYDSSGRVSRRNDRNYTSSGNQYEYFTYNTKGQVLSTYGTGTYPIDYEYDSYGRKTAQHQLRTENGSQESTIRWYYDDTNNTSLMKQKRHYSSTSSYDDTDFIYNDIGEVSRRTWDRGVYTDYSYSMGSINSTGDLLGENHSDSTPDVTRSYDRMGRLRTVYDYTGLRGMNYSEQNNLVLGWEDMPDGFYGAGSPGNIDYYWNMPGYNAGYSGLGFGGANFIMDRSTATGRVSYVHALADAQSYKSFAYTFDSDSSHLSKVQYGAFSLERNWESWRESRSSAYTRWSGAYRANFDSPNMDWQGNYVNYRLWENGSDSLAYKYNSSPSYIQYNFTYDARNQLTSYDRSDNNDHDVTNYTYDSAGNPTQFNYASKPDYNYIYNGQNESSGHGHVHDSDGNLTQDGDWYFYYDANNRLNAMKKKTNDKYLRFYYDYLGRRVEKKVYNNSTGTGTPSLHRKFVYEGMSLIAELDSSGAILKSFHWGPDRSDVKGGAGGAEGLVYMRDWVTNANLYPSYDLSGNLVGLLGGDGTYAAWYSYDAYGNVVQSGGSYKDSNPIGFSTQYTDRETGLVYFGLRFYDPQKARFLNRDPIKEAGGANLYRFVSNSPITHYDILGLSEEDGDTPRSIYPYVDPPRKSLFDMSMGEIVSKYGLTPVSRPGVLNLESLNGGTLSDLASSDDANGWDQDVRSVDYWNVQASIRGQKKEVRPLYNGDVEKADSLNTIRENPTSPIGGQARSNQYGKIGYTYDERSEFRNEIRGAMREQWAAEHDGEGPGLWRSFRINQQANSFVESLMGRGYVGGLGAVSLAGQGGASLILKSKQLRSLLGLRGVTLRGSMVVQGGVSTVNISMLAGKLGSASFSIIPKLANASRQAGANVLRIESSVANPALYRVLVKRYGMVSEGGKDVINILLR